MKAMKMMVEFDVDADIIDVPQHIIDEREFMRRRFIKWLYNKGNNHKYWTRVCSGERKYYALRYRSDAFVEWLNKKVLQKSNEKAEIVEQHVSVDIYAGKYPSIQL